MSTIIKNKEKIPKEIKKYYFIPCYNVIKNEIYFFEFFTEKIIVKPKKAKKKVEKELVLNQALTVNNILAVSKIIKKTKDKIRKKRSKTKANFGNIKDPKKLNKEDINFKKYLSSKDSKNFIKDDNNNDDNINKEINKSFTGKKKENKKKKIK